MRFWVLFVFVIFSRMLYAQCSQETSIDVRTMSNYCPVGDVTYEVTFNSSVPNGNNSICYGYAITYQNNIVESMDFGPIDQHQTLNNPFSDQMEITLHCDQGLTLFLHAWTNHECDGELCHEPHSQVVVLSPLPVTLTRFTSVPVYNGILLQWVTAAEINNKGFYVDHSNDNKQWDQAGFVPAAGTFQNTNLYEYLHENPRTGIHYYRLRQVDYDDKVSFSNVVSAVYKTADIHIYPTLVSDILYAYSKEEMSFHIYDCMGKMIKQGSMGPEINTIQVSELQQGLYIIVTENQQTVTFFKNE